MPLIEMKSVNKNYILGDTVVKALQGIDLVIDRGDIMRELNETNGITFIFSTHDERLLKSVKRLIRLEDGRIDDGGPPQ